MWVRRLQYSQRHLVVAKRMKTQPRQTLGWCEVLRQAVDDQVEAVHHGSLVLVLADLQPRAALPLSHHIQRSRQFTSSNAKQWVNLYNAFYDNATHNSSCILKICNTSNTRICQQSLGTSNVIRDGVKDCIRGQSKKGLLWYQSIQQQQDLLKNGIRDG